MDRKTASAVSIRTSKCIVYHGADGRRYFTASGAAKSLASKTYLDKFGCECEAQFEEDGELCETHRIIKQDYRTRFKTSGKRFDRYVRMLRYLLRKAAAK